MSTQHTTPGTASPKPPLAVDYDAADDPMAVRPRERASFALGDVAAQLVWTTTTSYLLFFYTNVALIGAASAGTILLTARLLDAVFDPTVGLILDRTNSRWGRARPYLLFGAPLLAGLAVLTFLAPFGNGTGGIIWAYATFILVGFAYSVVNVPYGALMSMATRDSTVRMRLSSLRSFGVGIGLVIVSVATQPLVALIGGSTTSKAGWMWTLIIFGVVATVLMWIVFAWVKERVPLTVASTEKRATRDALKTLVRNKPWWSVFVFSVLSFAKLGVITGGAIFYALEVLHNSAAISFILLTYSLSAIIGSLVTPRLLSALGHRRGILLGLAVSIVLTIPLVFLEKNLVAFLIVFFLVGLTGGLGFVAAPALTADTVEYQEYKSGQRNEGLIFAGYSMSTKIGAALGSAFLAWGLAAIHYTPTSHAPGISTGVTVIYFALPAALGVLQIIAIATYTLQRDLPTITQAITTQRASRRTR